jgi:hypothetical protein
VDLERIDPETKKLIAAPPPTRPERKASKQTKAPLKRRKK